jgi:hypothetical protein
MHFNETKTGKIYVSKRRHMNKVYFIYNCGYASPKYEYQGTEKYKKNKVFGK